VTDEVGPQGRAIRRAVERRHLGRWRTVDAQIEARNAAQAVARACSEPGVYRAGPCGTSGLVERFLVPAWGPPESIEASTA
jgi:hypothetical protein